MVYALGVWGIGVLSRQIEDGATTLSIEQYILHRAQDVEDFEMLEFEATCCCQLIPMRHVKFINPNSQ